MTPEFTEQARTKLTKLKDEGWTPADALRYLEKWCGSQNEQFNPDGMTLVEEVFGGVFEGRQGYAWKQGAERSSTPAAPSAIGNKPVESPFAPPPAPKPEEPEESGEAVPV